VARNAEAILRHVFTDLDSTDLADLAAVAEPRHYPPDVVLCHEGAVEDIFYVMIEGRVAVTKRVDETTEQFLKHLGPGEFFGEIALVQRGPRTASVRTVEPTYLLEIHREAFLSVLSRSAPLAMRVMLGVTWRLRDSDQRALTELRRRNAELAQAYAELEEQERLRSEFLTTISHELRTPLTVAMGYLQLINSGFLPLAQSGDFLKIIAQNLDEVVQLVNNLLFLQEIEMITPQFELHTVDEIIFKALEGLGERAAESGLTLTTRIEGGLPQIKADHSGLVRAVRALLDNAIKFSPDGGEIVIHAYAQGDQVCIAVRDPGVGFPIERIEELFQPFKRIEAVDGHLFGGVGIGLPIARGLVQLHGGRIEAQSEPGHGSTFTIILPLAPE